MTLLCFQASAEDTSFVELLGFSDDGKYMAFHESFVADGSGGYASAIRILDTVTDKYVKRQMEDIAEPELEPAGSVPTFSDFIKAEKAKAVDMLNEYGIKSVNGKTMPIVNGPRISSFQYQGRYLNFILNKKPINMKDFLYKKARHNTENAKRLDICLGLDDESHTKDGELFGYTLTAFDWITNMNFSSQVIYDDKHVPISRGCPSSYSINSAFTYKDTVVVLVTFNAYGFEGRDTAPITAPFKMSNLVKK